MARDTDGPDAREEPPRQPIDRLVGPIIRFMHVEAAGGVVLLAATAAALALANSPLAESFLGIWKTRIEIGIGSLQMSHSLKHWINDGLMAIFFFVVGLEVKRELVLGELRELRRALLPIAAALGGMALPAGLYLAVQAGEPGMRGWGIPMATDIAFVVGCMAVLGRRVPHILRVMVLSLAIVDDIGAILVIAVGYTEHIDLWALVLGFAGLGLVFVCGRIGVRSFFVYTVLGTLIWLAFHQSGVHATIAGVLLGLMTPARSHVSNSVFSRILEQAAEVFHSGAWEADPHRVAKLRRFRLASRETVPPLEYLENALHPWVSFVIMPVFALANAGVPIALADFLSPVARAVMVGLVIGKPVGIVVASWLVVRLVLGKLPAGLTWGAILGGGCLAGIGFTMALFISGLALEGAMLDAAKVGVLGASAIAAAVGMLVLLWRMPAPVAADGDDSPAA